MIETLQANWMLALGLFLLGVIGTIGITKLVQSKLAGKAEVGVKSLAVHVKDSVESHLHKAAPVAPIGPVTTPSADKVAAKHAALDKRIADGQAAQSEKDALTAAQAALDKLAQ